MRVIKTANPVSPGFGESSWADSKTKNERSPWNPTNPDASSSSMPFNVSEEELQEWEGGTSPNADTKVVNTNVRPRLSADQVRSMAKNIAGVGNEIRGLVWSALQKTHEKEVHSILEEVLKAVVTLKFVGFDLYRSIGDEQKGAKELWEAQEKQAHVLHELKAIADGLDARGLTAEADMIDRILLSAGN